jgi:hypothetical protein
MRREGFQDRIGFDEFRERHSPENAAFLDLRELANGNALAHPALRRLALRHVYDLAAVVIGTGRDATVVARSRGLRAARLRAILEAIQSGFADPAFSVQPIARRLGLSPRCIQDLPQESGASFVKLAYTGAVVGGFAPDYGQQCRRFRQRSRH